ncbi:O-methyltransferase [Paracnuella aquatica]|uniref:O-methyltransferase n=1 Tax=Paracnuella aquatica TaxID=2268757 RepID=UPI0019D46D8F|nr:class I SAM-dependent methyltransferase [Paracnuella aquatica]
MYSHFELARKYIHYYCTAMNGKGHGMHSPFVFQFILNVLHNGQGYAPPPFLEQQRKKLQRDKRMLHIEDFGAGSRTAATKHRTVAQLAATAVKPRKYSQMLHRLVRYYQPNTIVELGTSLGLTAAYLATANTKGTVYTIEGSGAVQQVANEGWQDAGIANIQSSVGNFNQELPKLLSTLKSVDLAYFDGNHRYAPTMEYFHLILPHATTDSIFVFDDIHWSAEMERAWAEIQQHPWVRCTVDLFFMGFVFFKTSFHEKQHFTVRF